MTVLRIAAFLFTAFWAAKFVHWILYMMLWGPLTDPLRRLPGPRGPYLESHLRQAMDPEFSADTYKDWRARYGQTFRFHGFGLHDLRLMSFDRRVIQFVMNSPVFEKPWQTRRFLGRLIGRGIFSMEGDVHDAQRRIIAPAFTDAAVKRMTPILFMKAKELSERWKDIISQQATGPQNAYVTPKEPAAVVDVAHWFSRASFDVIGLCGFNYDFQALQEKPTEIYGAYRRLFDIADKGLGLRQLLGLYSSTLHILLGGRDVWTSKLSLLIIAQAGRAIVKEKKAAYEALPEKGTGDKDLLSLLIASNASQSTDHLTDKELVDQVSTFLLAGSDTTSVALSWCLYHLAHNPTIQIRLRNAVHYGLQQHTCCGDEDLSDSSVDSGFQDATPQYPRCRWEHIESMTYLDYVVRETLRLCPPIHATIRVATEDVHIPIYHPITTVDGEMIKDRNPISEIKVRKGTYVHIPIEGLSHSEDIWGEDALEFNPSRWADVLSRDPTKPGFHNLMTFGYGRSSCMGYKLSILEMKAFIATLILQFEFCPAPDVKISKFNAVVTRPYVSGKYSEGAQLPISIRKFHDHDYQY